MLKKLCVATTPLSTLAATLKPPSSTIARRGPSSRRLASCNGILRKSPLPLESPNCVTIVEELSAQQRRKLIEAGVRLHNWNGHQHHRGDDLSEQSVVEYTAEILPSGRHNVLSTRGNYDRFLSKLHRNYFSLLLSLNDILCLPLPLSIGIINKLPKVRRQFLDLVVI